MSYYLGIDLGTTYTGAARFSDGRGEIVTLGDRSAVVPSVLFFRDDGDVLAGEPAVRRGLSDPARVVREFKRRMGDPTPIMVGNAPYSADRLMAELLDTILGTVSAREGGPPEGLGVTHPANWGPYKLDILRQAIRLADVGPTTVLSEPEAAAIHYAWTERLETGEIVAVYDLGGGTFDAAVLRKGDSDQRFEILGEAEGIERLGGVDFDEAVFQYVMRFLGSSVANLDPDDQATVQGIARLRQECVHAKEALSSDTDVSIPVFLPNLQTEVRLTRSEFEAMIRPSIGQTIEALRRSLRGAGIAASELAAVLLVGGSSRIPLVAQMVAAEVGRPIAVDIHPKHTVALGAAIAAAHAVDGTGIARRAVLSHAVVPAAVTAAVGRTELAPADWQQPTLEVPVDEVAGSGPTEAVDDRDAAPVDPEPVVAVRTSTVAPPPTWSDPEAGGGERSPTTRRLVVAVAVAGLAAIGSLAFGGGDDPAATTLPAALASTTAPTAATSVAPETTTTSAATTTTSTAILRDPEQLQVVEGDGVTVRESPGESGGEVRPLRGLTTFTTTGKVELVDGEEWLEVAEPVGGWVPAWASQPVEPGDRVTITGIGLEGDSYAVEYTANYEPLISTGEAVHIHFFFDTVPVEEAGVPGNGPWILYDTPAPFTEYGPADRPDGATQMCATPATSDHRVVDPRVFHCMDLPDAGEAAAGLLTVAWSDPASAFGPCRLEGHTEV